MESSSKKRHGFEGDSYNRAVILLSTLKKFILSDELKEFREQLLRISKLEFELLGNNAPTKEEVGWRAREYLVNIIPVLYERVVHCPRVYKQVDTNLKLESFVEGADHFYHLNGVAEEIETTMRKLYQHD